MNRSYIPFHLNKTDNITLYYDFKAKQFFKSPGGKQSSFIAILSGTVGIIIYALFKDMVMNIGGQNSLSIVSFSLFISSLLALGTIWGIGYAVEKNRDKIEIVATPSKKELLIYIKEGRKWLRTSLFLILFLFIITMLNALLLFLEPNSGLLFFTNTLLWAVLIVLIWGVRPLKRKTIYYCLKKELLNNTRELI